MNPIPQEKQDLLKQMSDIHGIPLDDLQKFYERHLNDPAYAAQFSTEAEKIQYIDMLLGGHIQDYVNSTQEEFEVIVITSSSPRETKKGALMSNHVVLAKRTPEQMIENTNKGTAGDNKVKWLAVRNMEDSGILEKILAATTGRMKVPVGKEEDGAIESFSRPNSEFIPGAVSFVTEANKLDYIRKAIRKVAIAQAGSNLSAKGDNGYAIPYSLRLIHGTIQSRRIIKKIDDETKKERETGIINIMDTSVQTNSEFFKNKTIPDKDNPGKTKTEYGGFGGFVDPEDIRDLDRGTLADFIGHINSANQMNIATILPQFIVVPKKPTERLQTQKSKAPAETTNAANI